MWKKHKFTQFEWAFSEQCLLFNLPRRAHLEAAAQIKRFGPKGKPVEGDAFHFIMSRKTMQSFNSPFSVI